MNTRVLAVDADSPEPDRLREAADVLLRGGLVAFATETVYGLGALADDASAVERIFAAKGRPATNPLIVHVSPDRASIDRVVAEWPARAERLASAFWPGPLTLVLPKSPTLPDITTAGQGTVGIRVPAHPVALALIRQAGRPIAAPSANRSNRISPTTASHVLRTLGSRIEMVLDSGPTRVGLESTVLDLTSGQPTILRPGMVTPDEIAAVLAEPVLGPLTGEGGAGSADEPSKSPGQLQVHYAPFRSTFRLERPIHQRDWEGPPTATIVIGNGLDAQLCRSSDRVMETPQLAAAGLYQALHDADHFPIERIVVVMPPATVEWLAIRDRLIRASRPWPTGRD